MGIFIESKAYRMMEYLYRLMVLNLFFMVTAIPLVTIGASSVAMYASIEEMKADWHAYSLSSYWRYFRQHFRWSTYFWCLGVVFCVGVWRLLQWVSYSVTVSSLVTLLLVPVVVQLALTGIMVVPLLSSTPVGGFGLLKQAWLLGNRHMGRVVVLCFSLLVIALFSYMMPALQVLCMFSLWHATAHHFLKDVIKRNKQGA